jgi:hypothetical protein
MIPVPIQMNKHDHRKPYLGDHGIQFEPIESQEPAAHAGEKPPRPVRQGRGRVSR